MSSELVHPALDVASVEPVYELEVAIVERSPEGNVLRERRPRTCDMTLPVDITAVVVSAWIFRTAEELGWIVAGVYCEATSERSFRVEVERELEAVEVSEVEANMGNGRIVTSTRRRYALGL